MAIAIGRITRYYSLSEYKIGNTSDSDWIDEIDSGLADVSPVCSPLTEFSYTRPALQFGFEY